MQRILRVTLQKAGYTMLSLWLAFHVFSVFISPAALPPVSPLLLDAYRLAMPYNDLLFQNHGYHFFAPDPGASSLISYRIPRPDDAPLIGRFPDPSIQPRLLYHRYFMLAENLWAFDEQTQDEMLEAYARHFAGLHQSEQISLSHLRHHPSSILRIQAGGRLDDPETYNEEPLESYRFPAEDSAGSSPVGNH